MRKYLLLIFVLASLIMGCSGYSSQQYDAECLKLLSQQGAREAREWLASGKQHSIGEYSHHVSVSHIETLYDKGAVAVTAVNIQEDVPGQQWTDMLVIELPDDDGLRKSLFKVESALAHRTGEFEPKGDIGQSYLLLWYEASGTIPP